MNQFILFFCFVPLFFINLLQAQEVDQLIPLSPNAASIAKYGEIPVSLFTGIPNIELPLYIVKSGELSLPLSLSYHAGGNKVESIASWVGLGWSLNTIPSISRNIRGIPDESSGGFFSKFAGKTVEEIMELGSGTLFDNFRRALYAGTADSEPDIFYYSLPEESGKFFYDQESGDFITFPKSNIKILREIDDFRLITQSGVEYFMNIKETTSSNGSIPINSTWYASHITSSSKVDKIELFYQMENQKTRTKNVVTNYQYLGGAAMGLPSDNGAIISINSTSAMVVDSIVFKNGYLKFNRNLDSFRNDLEGGRNLKNVSLYNNFHDLISRYELIYSYVQGTGSGSPCYNVDDYTKKWMFLDKLERVTVESIKTLSHSFTYNKSNIPPCRTSAAQDYWGYFNGKDQNIDLTPTYFIPNSDPPAQVSGADRSVNFQKSNFGIITKITYPTGGYTTFEFENNVSNSADLPPQYVSDYATLAGEEFFYADEPIPATSYFEKPFNINNVQDPFLNNNNPNGGAIVKFIIGLPGCDISQGANICARFRVIGLSSTNFHINYDLHLENTSYHLPNGDYKLTASFDQSPPQYQDFYFMAEWKKIDSYQTGNKYVGGLRIKEIRNFDNTSSQPIIKKYKYIIGYDSTDSSGDIFVDPNFSHSDIINYIDYDFMTGGQYSSLLLRVRSTSNMQQVTHSGSTVGYATVFEENNDPEKSGYKKHQFSQIRDEPRISFPYPPGESKELERGKIIEEQSYRWTGTGFELAEEKHYKYTSSPFFSNLSPQHSWAMKWGNLVVYASPPVEDLMADNLTPYLVSGGWTSLSEEVEKRHYQNDSMVRTTNYFYDNPAHLLNTKIETVASDGRITGSASKYPQDISIPLSPITALINQNRLGEIIETISYEDLNQNGIVESNEVRKIQNSVYKTWFTDIISPEFLQVSKGEDSLEDRVQFISYYPSGRVREMAKVDGSPIVYIWGYNEEYLIAKIENASYSQISSTYLSNVVTASNNDNDHCTGSSCKEEILRGELNTLRNSLPAAMVTTYTYDPLIGLTSTTNPKGNTTTFHYDSFNRLEFVKDEDDNIVKEQKYQYKNF